MDREEFLKRLRSCSELKNRPKIADRKTVSVESGGDGTSTFRVMQFNTLAKGLSTPEAAFDMVEEGALDWPGRRARLLEEMVEREADILALQEVDDFSFFESQLAQLGYTGFHVPKPSSPCLRIKDNIGPDGTAIFVNKAKFEIVKSGSEILTRETNSTRHETNSTAAWAMLRVKDGLISSDLLFVATHFKAKENAGCAGIRRQQAACLASLVNALKTANPQCGPLIICGDFNGEPSEQFYEVIKASIPWSSGEFGHGIESAYKVANGGQEPAYTTFKKRVGSDPKRRCIDYIWFSQSALRVVDVLELPTPEEIGHQTMLPSLTFPSDHLSLVATFKFY